MESSGDSEWYMEWLVFYLPCVPTFLSANSKIDCTHTFYRPVHRSLPVQALGRVSRSVFISCSSNRYTKEAYWAKRGLTSKACRHAIHFLYAVSNPSPFLYLWSSIQVKENKTEFVTKIIQANITILLGGIAPYLVYMLSSPEDTVS